MADRSEIVEWLESFSTSRQMSRAWASAPNPLFWRDSMIELLESDPSCVIKGAEDWIKGKNTHLSIVWTHHEVCIIEALSHSDSIVEAEKSPWTRQDPIYSPEYHAKKKV